jgi:hypothetical protein
MSQLTSPPTDPTIPGTEANSIPTTPCALVSWPGQLYFSVPVAGPTGSAAVTAPRRPVSGPGQLYFSVPVAGPTHSAAVTAPRRLAPLADHLSSQSPSRKHPDRLRAVLPAIPPFPVRPGDRVGQLA